MQTLNEQQATGPVLEPTTNGRWKTQGDLGKHQIEWLREKVFQFGPAKDQADRAIAHAAEVAEKIEGSVS
jgi:hypothetical protein